MLQPSYVCAPWSMNVRKRLHRGGIAKNMSEGDLVTDVAGRRATADRSYDWNSGRHFGEGRTDGEVMCEECSETTQSVVTPGGKFSSHRMKRTMMQRRNKWQVHAT